MEALVYAANGMYVFAYFMTDMLRMRLLAVSGAICLAVYFYCQPEPMMTVVAWNAFFTALNIFQIARILRARMKTAEQTADAAHRPLPPMMRVKAAANQVTEFTTQVSRRIKSAIPRVSLGVRDKMGHAVASRPS